MNTHTQTESKQEFTEAELKLDELESLFLDYIEDIDITDYLTEEDLEEGNLNDAHDLYDLLRDNYAFDVEIIYYSTAMKYLTEHDTSLSESLEIANEMGFDLESLNSETLASLHASRQAEDDYWTIKDEIDDILSR
jgi:hypothetical protein